MSSSRAKKLRDQNVVVTLVKDLTKRMSDFQETVEELKILKESIMEMNDEVVRQETENAFVLQRLKADLKENKIKAVNDAAKELNKTVISHEELIELQEHVAKSKNELSKLKSSNDEVLKERVEELVQNRLKVQQLEHDCKTAELKASNENLRSQIDNLNEYIKRMSEELSSQKQLTANIAGVNNKHQENKTEK